MNSAAGEVVEPRHFSPWLNSEHKCATCRYALGYDGVHLWCQQSRIVVVFPCGSWEREPGTEA